MPKIEILIEAVFFAVHARRIAALKALSFAPITDENILEKLYIIVFKILDKVFSPFVYARRIGASHPFASRERRLLSSLAAE